MNVTKIKSFLVVEAGGLGELFLESFAIMLIQSPFYPAFHPFAVFTFAIQPSAIRKGNKELCQ